AAAFRGESALPFGADEDPLEYAPTKVRDPGDPMDYLPTQVQHDEVADLYSEPALDDEDDDPVVDNEPTRIYRSGTVPANPADPFASQNFGKDDDARIEIEPPRESEQATVITSMDEVERRHAADAYVASRRASAPFERAPSSPAPVARSSSDGMSPVLIGVLIVLVLVLGAAVAVGIQLLTDDGPTELEAPLEPESPPLAAADAAYIITSQPVGARVELDGRFIGTTPATANDLVVGQSYHLRLTFDGYRSAEQVLEVTEGGVSEVEVSLRRLLGAIQVTTEPAGANLFLDGTFRSPSPATIDGLDPRMQYVIAASMPGYLTASRTISWPNEEPSGPLAVNLVLPVNPDAPAQQAEIAELEPEPEPQTPTRVEHTSSNQNSNQESAADRAARREREEREREERREREREREARREAEAREEEEEQVASSEPEETMGRLSVRAEPDGQVFVNGSIVATSTPLLDHELEAGTYEVKVYFITLRRFSEERRIRVVAGETRSVFFRNRD
ncbi:MAG: PEGA domain-containing protein, partial [Myxococcales bacterium]|nr:PEGA domain-containing protein [Myxococcales bacterium]